MFLSEKGKERKGKEKGKRKKEKGKAIIGIFDLPRK